MYAGHFLLCAAAAADHSVCPYYILYTIADVLHICYSVCLSYSSIGIYVAALSGEEEKCIKGQN